MKIAYLFAFSLLLIGLGCGSTTSVPTPVTPALRSYNGSASVGDFLSISLDPAALTLTYKNLSNGDTGVVPYTINSDGTYTLNDPQQNLLSAYEVPNYALLVQAAKSGPKHDALALIMAVESGSISLSTWEGHDYNIMQFRTAAGGVEAGSVSIDSQADVSVSSYWPYGETQGSPFNVGGFPGSGIQADPSGTFLKLADNNGTFDYIFGTPSGVFAVDTPNGSIFGLKKAATKDFDPTFAGTYKAIYYQKTGAATGAGNIETGTPSMGSATMVIDASANITVNDANGKTLLQAVLTPVADTSYLYGAGELQDPCFGLFTFRVTTASSQRDVFVSFMDRSILFSSFKANLPWGSGNTYDYLYGVGLK